MAFEYMAFEDAMARLGTHEGPVLLDLDETLYLRNSTEDFLDTVRPRPMAYLLLRALDIAKPWRRHGGEDVRDVFRIRAVLRWFPWSLRAFRRRIPELASQYCHHELLAMSRGRGREPYVVTLGFAPIVEPLVDALGLSRDRLVACSLDVEDRRRGKLALVEARLPPELVARSAFITDSPADSPLLERVALPLLTRSPKARYIRAHSDMYLPGRYVSEVKRPGQRYIWRAIIREDFAFWLLASFPAWHGVLAPMGLGFLALSFWCIYELGYIENDEIAVRFEADPRLTAEFHEPRGRANSVVVWAWALVTGTLGAALVSIGARPPSEHLALGSALGTHALWAAVTSWLGLLVGLRALYAVYNRLDKLSRVWPFVLLHALRAAAFVVVLPVSIIGALGLLGHAVARWVPYVLYRYGGSEWPDLPVHLLRLVLCLLAFGFAAIGLGWAGFAAELWVAVAFLAYSLLLARQELRAVLARCSRIDR